ncbi:conserved Plasmodium protein, unknown function [Plasmodium gallinaceum]|uniref:CHCH domain-containing protein n=1 Tax=Plasmodium gallinaceum TaxID=5849 RepID=A0A1J1GZN0_PLAGA|nr:conserved Plasmodium protein, unknown function [Plasmodium gallinaceum]CRG98032.1 conserved Plasmodium protein, unknown function [Plasmodium gallinaceum]
MISLNKNLLNFLSIFKRDSKNDEFTHEYLDDKIENTKCESEYNILLECLDKYDRNWRKCQEELKIFKGCYNENNKIIIDRKN